MFKMNSQVEFDMVKKKKAKKKTHFEQSYCQHEKDI